MPQITKIVGQATNPNRVNVFVNDKFFVGLDKFTWVQYNFKVGDEISTSIGEKLKQQAMDGKAYDKALKLLGMRPQSIREIYQKLRTKFEPEAIQQTVARLKREGWLDDQKFALAWVRERSQTRNRSITHLKSELIQKGIAQDIIQEVLSQPELADQELVTANKLVEKFQNSKTPDQLKAYLARKGFSYSIIVNSLKSTQQTD
ncbi:RecX family transcriptional regulator [Patescibacteria group bacterium]|nr:RecX family transcriptional regulator [Patescibacteria group bacterium]